jgi:hypothetical protein
LQLMLRPSQVSSRSGVRVISGTRAGAPIGMAGAATTTGADTDPAIVVGMAIEVGTATMATMAITVVLAIMVALVGRVDMAVTADRCNHQPTELI